MYPFRPPDHDREGVDPDECSGNSLWLLVWGQHQPIGEAFARMGLVSSRSS